jgi:DNA-binding winged helix-turn-helix (wHTH) protein/Tfp pilus assembly protein PilF/TolB-like protein
MNANHAARPAAEPNSLRARFGEFVLDARQRRLERNDEPVELTPKQFDTLLLLVESAGDLVGKERFYAALWPNSVVSDNSLNKYIWHLRRVLGDSDQARFIETVPKLGYRFVAPVERIKSPPPGEAAADVPATQPSVPVNSRNWRTRWWLAGLAAAALVVVAARWYAVSSQVPASSRNAVVVPAQTARASIVVLPFIDATYSGTGLHRGLQASALISLDLSLVEQVRVISPDHTLESSRADAVVSFDAANSNPQLLSSSASRLSSDWVVAGTLRNASAAAEQLVIDAAVFDGRSGRIVAKLHEQGSGADLARVASTLAEHVRDVIGVPPMTENMRELRSVALTNNLDAVKNYVEGQAALYERNGDQAQALLERAVAIAPEFLPARLALARAYFIEYDDGHAVSSAREALQRASTAPRELRLSIEAQLAEAEGRWIDARETYSALHRFFPDETDYTIALARTQAWTGQADAAQKSIDGLIATGPDEPRVDMAAAQIAEIRSDYPSMLAALHRMEEKAVKLGSEHLRAEALMRQAEAQTHFEKYQDAEKLLGAAREGFIKAGDATQAAMSDWYLANNFSKQRNPARAEALYRSILPQFERNNSMEMQASIHANLIGIERTKPNPQGARDEIEKTLQLRRQSGDLRGEGWALGELAVEQTEAGETDSAVASYRSAIALEERAHASLHICNSLSRLAAVLRYRGEFDEASKVAEQALRTAREAHLGDKEIEARVAVADIALARGDVQAARESFADIAQAVSKADHSPWNDLLPERNALVALAGQHPADALNALAPDRMPKTTNTEVRSEARIELLRALAYASTGATQQAGASARAAHELIGERPSALDRLRVDWLDFIMLNDAGKRSEAQVLYAAIVDSAKRYGLQRPAPRTDRHESPLTAWL